MANITRRQRMEACQTLATKIIQENAHTLATRGISEEAYRTVFHEAMLANPDLIDCDNLSLAKAMRKCCQDGLLPDGRQAVIYPSKNGANYVPMKEGLLRIIHNSLDADIASGFIRACELPNVRIVERGGEDPIIEVPRNLDPKADQNIVGAWCWVKVKDRQAQLTVLNQHDIEAAEAASRMRNAGPWSKFRGAMAEKSAIKSAMNKLRYLVGSFDAIHSVLENDDERPNFVNAPAVDITPQPQALEELPEVEVETPPAPKKAAPKKKRKVKEQPVETEPETSPETETPATHATVPGNESEQAAPSSADDFLPAEDYEEEVTESEDETEL